MYVDNGKISSRQIFRLYVFDLMGIATLLLPTYLVQICGIDGVFAIILGTLIGLAYLLYLGWIMKKMKTDMCSYLKEKRGKVVRNISLILVMVHSIVTAAFCGSVFANLMQYSLIQESSFEVVLLVILIIAAYAVSGGIEGRARVYEVLFWFVLLPYVAMMLASIKDFEIPYVDGLFTVDIGGLLQGSYLVFLFLTPLFFSLFLIGEKEKNYGRNIVKTVAISILVSAVILLGSYILLVGNFGEKALATMKYPVVSLMSTVQFRGNFLKRMDALMVAVWFFTLFALLNLHLHYGVGMLKELTSAQKKTKAWQVIVPAVFVYGIAYAMHMFPKGSSYFLNYYVYIAVPLMIVGPFLLLRKGR